MESAALRLLPSALLLVVVWARVEPPANVTLRCQNMDNVLMWQYDQITPGLMFRVDIRAYYRTNAEGFRNVSWVKPPALQADLSFLSDLSEMYFLAVTAVVGDEESDPSPSEDGITFSYVQDAQVDQKCFVDLSSVNVTAKPQDQVLLRFRHPWLSLSEEVRRSQGARSRSRRSHELPAFEYTVMIVSQNHHEEVECEEAVCEKLLPVDPQQDRPCLQISGNLKVESRPVVVKGSQPFCAREDDQGRSVYAWALVLSAVLVALAVLALILYMSYRKKTNPSKGAPAPSPLVGFDIGSRRTQQTWSPVEEPITVMDVEPPSPTPLLHATDTEDSVDATLPATNSADYTLRLRLGVSDEGEPDGVEEEPAYRSGGSLDEDDFTSSYEKRGVPVELGPGDQAEGYRG